MKYIAIPDKQEHISFELAKEIHEHLTDNGVMLLSRFVWMADKKEIAVRTVTMDWHNRIYEYYPALTCPELGVLLPLYNVSMRVHHKTYGRNQFLCDHSNDVRYGSRPRDEFHFEETEIRGRRFLKLIIDNPEFLKKLKDGNDI